MPLSKAKKLHILWGLFAFLSFISFVNVESAWVDEHHAGTYFIVAGVVFFLIGAYFLRKVIKNTNGGGSPGTR